MIFELFFNIPPTVKVFFLLEIRSHVLRNAAGEPWIQQYIVASNLLRALARDKEGLAGLKLATVWLGSINEAALQEKESPGLLDANISRASAPFVIKGANPPSFDSKRRSGQILFES